MAKCLRQRFTTAMLQCSKQCLVYAITYNFSCSYPTSQVANSVMICTKIYCDTTNTCTYLPVNPYIKGMKYTV